MIGDAIIELIEYICDLFDINEEKIALTGHSMGGTGTWDLALLYPNKFLRIAPLSGSVKITTENINQLKHLQIRAYVGSKDTIVSPESSRKMIYELQQYHTDAEIIIFENATHFDIPQLAYLNDKELIQWLIS